MSNIVIIPLGIGATAIDRTNLLDYPKVESVVLDLLPPDKLEELVNLATPEDLLNPVLILDSIINSFIGVIDSKGLLHTLSDSNGKVLDKTSILDYLKGKDTLQLTIVLNSLQAIVDSTSLTEDDLAKIYDAALVHLNNLGNIPVNEFFAETKEILG